jgi:hypothetical protein
VPFVSVSRDKRGYEQISLMHVSARRGRPSKPRVLYVFRTPPGVKIGREPFDETIQRELEAQNPGIVFDWKKLSDIPVPAPDVEYWRERRKADKAAKIARRAEEQADAAVSEDPSGVVTLGEDDPSEHDEGDETVQAGPANEAVAPGSLAGPPGQRRGRRRGGRRRHRGGRPELVGASQHPASQEVQAPPAASSAEGPGEASSAPEPSGDPSKLARDRSKEA